MEQSEQIGELAAALAKAQGQVKGAAKDSQNPHFRSRYADLASVWEACREALSQNGIAVVQMPGDDPERVVLTTQITHTSGQWMRGTMAVKPVKNDPQGVGSALTYLRRYSLAAAVGVAPEDDDGEAAMGRSGTAVQKAPPARITAAEAEVLTKAIVQANRSVDKACKAFGVQSLAELTTEQAQVAWATLKKDGPPNDAAA